MSLPKTFTAGERLFASDLNDNFDDLDGRVDTVETTGYRFAGTKYYFSDGSFAKADPLGTGDIGLRAIRVRMVGGGGGGGGLAGTTDSSRSGGGGGGYSELFITNIAALDASVTVTRAAGGAGVSDAPGNAGAASSGFGMTANGGAGGGASRGVGGSASGGDINRSGGAGGQGFAFGSAFSEQVAGFGGGSHFAQSTLQAYPAPNTSLAGAAGLAHGGGGAAAVSRGNSGDARAGGNGANGIVIVDCYV
jgi:hypothetical protein